jgi:hypothetical protein
MYDGEIDMAMLEESLSEFSEAQAKKKTRWSKELDALLIKVREEYHLTWEEAGAWWHDQFGWGTYKSLNSRYKVLKRDV